ncbi:phosphatidylinositol-specific phospholipase C1-like protein [uncultured Algibacter sp.]|uniref:phosphatidylinositol-specific phospholipase C1-like protein n=1 Tax=uncultured Algibacter sp. TaxID=298659 RepID=UPI00261AC0B8|nr:phosphatidylinositol-specific phospholipase C1-like protein [uncultured Algibacter sp.]
MKGNVILMICMWLVFSCSQSCKEQTKLNEIQVIGSHNSYKRPIEKPLWEYIYAIDSVRALSLQYGHISIEKQLDLGLRNLELDVFYDPKGGHFSNPKGLEIVKKLGQQPLAFDEDNKLSNSGLKLFHVQDIDFRSHHLLFKDCLKEMKLWSDKNSNHTPIIVLMNTKDKIIERLKEPIPFSKEAYNDLDNEISSIFSKDQLITPDLVRGKFKTLEEAVLTKGWPNFDDVKGRFLFVLDENKEKINRYLKDHPNLENRILFVNSKEGNPEAAFRIVNNPIKDFGYIKTLVAKGYMVRTRADSGTKESRTNDYSKFEKAKASGAQVISTDYYIPTTLYKSDYKVIFDDGTYERIQKN